jgi:hypothetical protein
MLNTMINLLVQDLEEACFVCRKVIAGAHDRERDRCRILLGRCMLVLTAAGSVVRVFVELAADCSMPATVA